VRAQIEPNFLACKRACRNGHHRLRLGHRELALRQQEIAEVVDQLTTVAQTHGIEQLVVGGSQDGGGYEPL
jgi:hypothetical protein